MQTFCGVNFYLYLCIDKQQKHRNMAKVTVVKKGRNAETLNQIELSTIVSNIRGESFGRTCAEIRQAYPLAEVRQRFGDTNDTLLIWTRNLPRICFSAEMVNRNKQRVMKTYNGLVLLEVNNLGSFDEAEAVRKSASLIPQTMLAFVGSSGLSVKIVCRGELFDGGQRLDYGICRMCLCI